MAKYTPSPVGAAFNTSAAGTVNQNWTDIAAALENTLSRDGTTPNQMTADIDLNDNDLLNINVLDAQTLIVNGTSIGAVTSNIDTRADALTTNIPSPVNFVKTAGYATVGDYGGALYKRAGSEPSHTGKFQSADGAWWEIAEPVLFPEMFGAKGDGVTIDATAIQNCVNCRDNITFLSRTYHIATTTITIPIGVGVRSQANAELHYTGYGVALDVYGTSKQGYASKSLELPDVRRIRSAPLGSPEWDLGTDTTSVGIRLNACHYDRVTFGSSGWFRYGLVMRATADSADVPDGNCVFNKVTFGRIYNCWHGIDLEWFPAGGGHIASGVNSNNFHGGAIANDAAWDNEPGICKIYAPDAENNWNSFNDIGLEAAGHTNLKGVYDNSLSNIYINCRTENGLLPAYIHFGPASMDCKFISRSPTGTSTDGGNWHENVLDEGYGNMFWWSSVLTSKFFTFNFENGKIQVGNGTVAPAFTLAQGYGTNRAIVGDAVNAGVYYYGFMNQAEKIQTSGTTTTSDNHITFNYAAPATITRAVGVSADFEGLVTFFDLNGNITLTHTASPTSGFGQFVLTGGANLLMTAKRALMFRIYDGNYYQI